MKVFSILLVILLCAAVIGLMAYQGFVTKDLEARDVFRAVLILAGLVLTLFKIGKGPKVSNKKALYEKAFPEYIQNVFSMDRKLEKQFFNAVDNFNNGKYAAGLKKLEALRRECQRTADLYAVTVFTALCLDRLGLYEKAIAQYQSAQQIRPNARLASNTGFCHDQLGQREAAIRCYEQAISLDSKNANALNNLGALYFQDGDYETALSYAEQAVQANPRMPQALSLAAMCCALLGRQEAYESYYRRAVSAGYDGASIKNAIRALQA